jgi:phosphoadenosine phosphosulfate reductase
MVDIDVEAANERLNGAKPLHILAWAAQHFPSGIAATSSFQTQSVPLLHMIAQVMPAMPIYFLDTGFHFAETLEYRDRVAARLGLHVVTLTPEGGHDGFLRQYGQLHRHDPDRCCFLNKVEPFERVKADLAAWVAGIRRDQTRSRQSTPVVSLDRRRVYRICPMIHWDDDDVRHYIATHDLPIHPLTEKGYTSIGCAPCTRPVREGEGQRAGRWPEKIKTECGLHTPVIDQGAAMMRQVQR